MNGSSYGRTRYRDRLFKPERRLFETMKFSDMADADLIEGLKRRDPECLAAVYDRYAPVAFSLFLRITRDQTASEDLLQELYIRVWNRGRDFDPQRGSLGVWIVAIARNMAIDYVRSAQARFNTRLRPIDSVDPLHLPHKKEEADSRIDNSRAVTAAFSSLNENEKRVLELAYFEGCSQSEIAEKLHEPLGTVKSWVRSGLIRLRSVMKLGAAQ